MKGDISYLRLGWFAWEARGEVTPHAWVIARGWSRRAARRAIQRRMGLR